MKSIFPESCFTRLLFVLILGMRISAHPRSTSTIGTYELLTTSHAPDHSRPPISPDSQTCQQTLDTSLISISFPFLFQLDFQFAGLLMDQFLCATHSAYKVFLFVRLSESVLLPSINSEPSVMWHIIFSDAAQIGNFLKR